MARSRYVVGVLVCVAGALAAMGARGPLGSPRASAASFSVSVVLGGHGELTAPTALAYSPDGRIFVAEAAGRIKVFQHLGDPAPTVFADLSTEVYSFQGHGLMGLALDPQFPTRPYVYALYSRDAKTLGGAVPGWHDACPTPTTGCVTYGRLVRLTANGNVVSGAAKVLVDGWCNQFQHTVDALRFGPDGMLYAAGGDGTTYTTADYGQFGAPKQNPCGDPPGGVGATLTPPTTQGGSLRAQDVRTNADPAGLDGAVIRVDPSTGLAAPANPFSSSPDVNKRRIIAYGLRNPFRFAFRPGTSELWVGDAGWNRYEEIDRIITPAGTVAPNFGWPCYEGPSQEPEWAALNVNLCTSLYAAHSATGPAFSYPDTGHVIAGDGCAEDPTLGTVIAGVDFSTASAYPAALHNALFFVDYGRACIWAAPATTNGLPSFGARRLVATLPAIGATDLVNGPNGDVLIVNNNTSTVLQLHYA